MCFPCFIIAERLVGIYEDVDENSTEPSVFSEEGGETGIKSHKCHTFSGIPLSV